MKAECEDKQMDGWMDEQMDDVQNMCDSHSPTSSPTVQYYYTAAQDSSFFEGHNILYEKIPTAYANSTQSSLGKSPLPQAV